jgi:hypothetical protein
MNVSAKQAKEVLETLVAQGRLRWAQIEKVLRGQKEIERLKARLASLEKYVSGTMRSGRRRGVRRAGRKLSPKTRALRRLQGKYMGYVRNLKPAEKARVKAVREKQGMQAAIRLAASLGSK